MFERYIFITLPQEEAPAPAGLFSLDTSLGVGSFSYGRKYLLRNNAIAIDPINLPLSNHEFTTKKNSGVFGVLGDMFPDSWGKYVLSKKLNIPFGALQPHDYFDLVTTNSVGALSVGVTPEIPTTKKESPISFPDIKYVLDAYDRLTQDDTLPPEVLFYLEQGTSLGGAQPKCAVEYNGEEYIAKFENSKIKINMPRIEYATMLLAQKCGINTPTIHLEEVGNKSIYLIKRFDRHLSRRKPFISSHALSNLDLEELEKASYISIAGHIRKISNRVNKDIHELYRRMAFNVFVGNADDHLRNHGCLYDEETGWSLSPAYDILPIPRKLPSFSSSLNIGSFGTSATIENLLSECNKFNLSISEASSIVEEVKTFCTDWEKHYTNFGVSRHDRDQIRMCFNTFTNN